MSDIRNSRPFVDVSDIRNSKPSVDWPLYASSRRVRHPSAGDIPAERTAANL